MFSFAIDYFIFTLAASVGVIQASASIWQLNGLLFFKSRFIARGFGILLPLVAFIWFFTAETRNINDYDGSLDANDQAILFLGGAGGALLFTIIVSSIINASMRSNDYSVQQGLESLMHNNYIVALSRSIKFWGNIWRT